MKKASVAQQLASAVNTANLPAVPSIDPPKIAPVPFDKATPENDIVNSDIELANVAAIHIYNKWCYQNHSMKELASLFKTTVEFTKHRRKLLNMSYGPETGAKGRRAIVYPLD